MTSIGSIEQQKREWERLSMAKARQYWLVKSEPSCFSVADLRDSPGRTTCWDGVRNYQARNLMREMCLGDRVLFYHSSVEPPAVAGTAIVVREAYPDHTAWEAGGDHFDPKASPENPIWEMVDIELERVFDEPIPIGALREHPVLANMELLRRGSRLSVQPVRKREFDAILKLAGRRRTGKRAAKRTTTATVATRAQKKKPARRRG